MSNTLLTEAFQALSLLKEETFDVTRDDLSALRDFLDVDDDTVEIIDTEADTVDDLKDSYIGKVILECPVCTSMVYKDKDAIELNDELAVANEDEECPYCHTAGGFKIIGEVSEFNPNAEVEEETEEEVEEEVEDIPETDIEAEDVKVVEESLTEKTHTKSLYDLIYGPDGELRETLKVKESFDDEDDDEEVEVEEEKLKEAASGGKVTLQVTYEVYDRYGYGGRVKTAKVSGKDLRHALTRMVDKMGLYIDSEEIEEENLTVEQILDRIEMSNGDGCDFVLLLKNLTTGDVLFDYDEADEEENWDNDEELEESTTTDLVVDRRETSIDASDGEKPMREGLGDVKIELDGKEIKVEEDEIKIKELAPEISEESTEVITPIENEAEFVDTITADEEEEDDYIDLDVEEIDEKSFDDLIESYLLKTFDNVANYNTTRGYIDGNKIMMEGLITYTSGKKLSTVFTFESKYAKDGHHVIFEGKNKHLTEAFDTCVLSGKIIDKKLLPRTFKPLQ